MVAAVVAMNTVRIVLVLVLFTVCGVRGFDDSDVPLVRAHVAQFANATFREPSGVLKYPYLVPGGPYNESWEWDSLFMGVALREWGSHRYLAGTMMNFLDHTNVRKKYAMCSFSLLFAGDHRGGARLPYPQGAHPWCCILAFSHGL